MADKEIDNILSFVVHMREFCEIQDDPSEFAQGYIAAMKQVSKYIRMRKIYTEDGDEDDVTM